MSEGALSDPGDAAPRRPDKAAIRQAFDRAAAGYDRLASVQREACEHLLALIGDAGPTPATLLDAGCGTGFGATLLRARFPSAHVVALDLAPAMLAAPALAGTPRLCADMEALPLAGASVDAVWSSLALQWCDARPALAEIARCLRPGGHLWLATLGPGTLAEVADAFAPTDPHRHVIDFLAPEAVAGLLAAQGLQVIASRRECLRVWEPDLATLLRNIRALGAGTLGPQRRRAPLGRRAWQGVQARYERHRTPRGLPASYDLLCFTAFRQP